MPFTNEMRIRTSPRFHKVCSVLKQPVAVEDTYLEQQTRNIFSFSASGAVGMILSFPPHAQIWNSMHISI